VCYGSKIERLSRAAGTTAALALGVALALGLGRPASGATAAHAATAATANPALQPGIIPQPNAIVPQPGWFTYDSRTVIRVPADDPDARSAADYLADLLTRCLGHAPAIESGDANAAQSRLARAKPANIPPAHAQSAITFRRRAGLGPEAYRLEITARGIVISATGGAGLFYGAVTLWQMLTPGSGSPAAAAQTFPAQTLHAQTIRDAPAYPWRGLMLDSARHFQSVTFIRSMIDTMAMHKLNVLHWHLTDDQGWRLEIRKYPRLTSVGAWRMPATWPGETAPDATAAYGGFYTQDQVRGIVAYAATRHIDIVPEIEMPGHAQAAVAAYPQLGVTDAQPHRADLAVSAKWGVHTHLFNVEPSTFTFLEDVLAEVMDMFPSAYVHVGGDEAVKDEWNASPSVRARTQALGIQDADALQAYFTQEIGRYLSAHGRRLIGWDEILRPGLAPDAIIMSWRGTAGARAAAKRGNDTLLSPWPPLYFDNRQSALPTEAPGRLNIVSLEDVYRFELHDPTLSKPALRHVLGIQGNLWTEHIQTDDRVQWMAWPRAAAVAELGWSAASRRDWPNFLQRLVPLFARYDALGIPYADSVFAVASQVSHGRDQFTLALSNQASMGEIRYTLDGQDPGPSSMLYAAPLTLPLDTEIRAASFLESARASRVWMQHFDARSLARRDSHDLELCSKGIGLLLEPAAGSASRGAPLALDIMNPCWIDRGVDLDRALTLTAAVVPLPFNYEIGTDAAKLRVGDARSADGELEVHLDGCDTPVVAMLPLAAAARLESVTQLPPATLPRVAGRHDLCFRFARPRLDPLWALDWIEIGE